KSGGAGKSAGAGGSRGGFQPGGGGPSGGMNGGMRASGGFGQPGAGTSNYQNSMNRLRGGARGPGTAGPGAAGPGEGAPGNPTDRRNNRIDNRTDNRNDRQDVRDNRGPLDNNVAPFSAGWYANYPNAWRYANPGFNAYALAAAPNMYGYWGMPAVGGVPVGAPAGTALANTQPAGGETAQNPANTGEWMPLGVYSLTHDNTPGEITRALQLATNKAGEIKGNHIDLLTDTTSEVNGRYDDETKTIHWTIGKADGTVFTAKVADFNSAGKPVPAISHYANGSSAKWVMTPMPSPETADAKTGD
ncbi:MAG: hypothetical protein ACKO5E_00135, partial [bacterium]